MISPYKIKWAGLSSLELDFNFLTELSFNGDSGQTSSFLNRESVSTERFDGVYRRIHSYKWNEVVTPTITFIKQNFEDFTPIENRKILSWLTLKDKPDWLDIYHDDSDVVSYRLYGNWIEIEQYKLGNGRVVGYVATFESSSPYVFTQKKECIKQFLGQTESEESTEFNVYCESDEYNKPIYPKTTIIFNNNIYFLVNENPMQETYRMIPNTLYQYNNNKYIYIDQGDKEFQGKHSITGIFDRPIDEQTAGADTVGNYYYSINDKSVYKGVLIQTQNEDETISYSYGFKHVSNVGITVQIQKMNGEEVESTAILTGNINGETIVLDGANKIVSSTVTPMRIIGNDFNWEWPFLSPGNNTFKIIGDCTLKFEWVEPRKVGSL